MRQVIWSVLLLPVLAHGQATHTAAAASSAPTLQAKATAAPLLHNAPQPLMKAATPAPDPDPLVPVHESIIERHVYDSSEFGSNENNAYVLQGGTEIPRLVRSVPVKISLHEMESVETDADVVVSFTVDFTGAPRDLKVTKSGGAALDRRALDAIAQYRFQPATDNNAPVQWPVTIEIKLKKS